MDSTYCVCVITITKEEIMKLKLRGSGGDIGGVEGWRMWMEMI